MGWISDLGIGQFGGLLLPIYTYHLYVFVAFLIVYVAKWVDKVSYFAKLLTYIIMTWNIMLWGMCFVFSTWHRIHSVIVLKFSFWPLLILWYFYSWSSILLLAIVFFGPLCLFIEMNICDLLEDLLLVFVCHVKCILFMMPCKNLFVKFSFWLFLWWWSFWLQFLSDFHMLMQFSFAWLFFLMICIVCLHLLYFVSFMKYFEQFFNYFEHETNFFW